MEFILLGFDQPASTRRFRFEIIGGDRCRRPVVVLADLLLAHEYSIQLQELPLLCREVLEHSETAELSCGVVTLTEAHMAARSKAARDASEAKKARKVRPAVSSKTGEAWRSTHVLPVR